MFNVAACLCMSTMTHFKYRMCVSSTFIYTMCLVIVSFSTSWHHWLLASMLVSPRLSVQEWLRPKSTRWCASQFWLAELWMSSAFQPLPWSVTSSCPDIYSWFSCIQSALHWPTSQALQLCWGLNTNYIWNEIHPITLFFPSLQMLFGVKASNLCSGKI